VDRVTIERMCAGRDFQVGEKVLVIPAGLGRTFALEERKDLD